MKSVLYLFACSLACVVIVSCSKSNSGSSTATFSATVNGKTFNPAVVGGEDVTSGGFFYIAGNQFATTDTVILSLILADTPVLNTPLPFDGVNTIMAYQDFKTGVVYSNEGIPGPGAITVTYHNTQGAQLTGTFYGTLYNQTSASDSIVITNGKFNVLYTTQ